MSYWLIKSEGDCYSIDKFCKDKKTLWTGIRNFQARNYMMKDMKIGDLCLFYHSNDKPSGVYGLAKVTSQSVPDPTQFLEKDEHFDRKSKKEKPLWFCVEMSFVKKYPSVLSLEDIKKDTVLKVMQVAKRGNRLSVTPVSTSCFKRVEKILN